MGCGLKRSKSTGIFAQVGTNAVAKLYLANSATIHTCEVDAKASDALLCERCVEDTFLAWRGNSVKQNLDRYLGPPNSSMSPIVHRNTPPVLNVTSLMWSV